MCRGARRGLPLAILIIHDELMMTGLSPIAYRDRRSAMAKLKLKTLTRTQGNNQALKDGTVRPGTFDFEFEEVPVLVDGFRRMVRGLEFDIAEMAITTYICAKAFGKRFTACPIFLVRAFHH